MLLKPPKPPKPLKTLIFLKIEGDFALQSKFGTYNRGVESYISTPQKVRSQMMVTKTSTANKLKDLKNKAKRKEPKGKKEVRVVSVLPELQPSIRQLCELAHIFDAIKPLLDQHKSAAQEQFFLIWTEEMWEGKSKPDNFNVRLKRLNAEGNPTALDDCQCQFQLKFRTSGISKKLPNEEDLPELDCLCGRKKDCELCEGKGFYQQTVAEVLIDTLVSDVVGLSEKNAREFVEKEVSIEDDYDFAMPINQMTQQKEGEALKTLGDKLIAYLHARARKAGGKVSLAAITDEEIVKGLNYYQVVSLKEGLLDRIFQYAGSLEQLRKLLKFIDVTRQVSNFNYGISDEADAKVERVREAVSRYLVPAAAE